jgi:glycosyltransferase involved in cell wall biosynthesis
VRVAACIPTKDRADAVRALLGNMLDQQRLFDVVLVVDASADDATAGVCAEVGESFGGALRYERCEPGLPLQRRRGIELLKADPGVGYICFLDDDVLLDPEFCAAIIALLESPDGKDVGGVTGYDRANWGRPFTGTQRLFHRIGVYDGELRAGRWLYCGYFLELDHLERGNEIVDCDFVPGGHTIWRTEVFDHFAPPSEVAGYAVGEDKHLSLRVRTRYRLVVEPRAGLRHLRAEGGRPKRFRRTIQRVRMDARLLRECDPNPSILRYASFIGATFLHALTMLVVRLGKRRVRDLDAVAAMLIGMLSCVVAPPRRTRAALDTARERVSA